MALISLLIITLTKGRGGEGGVGPCLWPAPVMDTRCLWPAPGDGYRFQLLFQSSQGYFSPSVAHPFIIPLLSPPFLTLSGSALLRLPLQASGFSLLCWWSD